MIKINGDIYHADVLENSILFDINYPSKVTVHSIKIPAGKRLIKAKTIFEKE